jgi:hypothetical protein
MKKRVLALSTERLGELSSDDLRGVVGGVTGDACLTGAAKCQVSDRFQSFCYCLTGYCSIECG